MDAPSVSVAVDHPRLTKLDPKSIRQFLNYYDQYVNKIISRSKHPGSNVVGTEAYRPVDIQF